MTRHPFSGPYNNPGGPGSPFPYGSGQGPQPGPPEYGGYAGPVLGGAGRRLVARIIDFVVVSVVVSVVVGIATGFDVHDNSGLTQFGSTALYAVVYFVYDGFQFDRWGQTLGKRALGIKVVRVADGGPASGTPAWTRAAVYSLPLILWCVGELFWLVNVLWLLWDQPWHQALHDKAAKTVVIRKP